jgi:hypothetical protein
MASSKQDGNHIAGMASNNATTFYVEWTQGSLLKLSMLVNK